VGRHRTHGPSLPTCRMQKLLCRRRIRCNMIGHRSRPDNTLPSQTALARLLLLPFHCAGVRDMFSRNSAPTFFE
jgi:hypothetical protein